MRKTLTVAAALGIIIILGGWTHGSAPAKFEGKNWHEALAAVPCSKLAQDGHNIKVTGIVVVDGNPYPDPLITNPGEVNMLEKRCFGKG